MNKKLILFLVFMNLNFYKTETVNIRELFWLSYASLSIFGTSLNIYDILTNRIPNEQYLNHLILVIHSGYQTISSYKKFLKA